MNQTSMFDPQAFYSMTIEDSFEDRIPLELGDYTAVIGEITPRAWSRKDGTGTGYAWDIPLIIDVPADMQVRCNCGPTMKITDSVIIDMTPNNTMDNSPGKNSKLKSYRVATDTNKKGERFGMMTLQGKVVLVRIGHKIWNDRPIEEVKGIAAV